MKQIKKFNQFLNESNIKKDESVLLSYLNEKYEKYKGLLDDYNNIITSINHINDNVNDEDINYKIEVLEEMTEYDMGKNSMKLGITIKEEFEDIEELIESDIVKNIQTELNKMIYLEIVIDTVFSEGESYFSVIIDL
jgi:hypothetical protein